ncbi:hypothetical protein BVG16_01665 [Paenibacillus selenitireducens]|uniref:Uncharacterized protein n=1 Tax=Paenibacillus selenitireducens TaxID=1324314 RepID=A0A1T2XMH8_9BACL|nr:helix-turn-helix domain-containing protein [Paenibacillus selenitireducens]OPA81074.1 hypothetical protein BVG16_01665 [Paenibacillus selenitireducens]
MWDGQASVMNWNDLLQQYRTLIYILLEKRNEAGISHVTVTELSKVLRLSHADISSQMQKCIDLGLIEVADPSGFHVIHADLTNSPIGHMSQLLKVIQQLPDSSFEQQAEQLGFTLKELEAVYGYFIYLLL